MPLTKGEETCRILLWNLLMFRTNKFLGDQFLPKVEQRLKKWNSKSLDQLTFQL